jgi:hypothetical protein
MPFFKATDRTLPSSIVEPLVEGGSTLRLVDLAKHFRGVVEERPPEESIFDVSVRIYHTLHELEAQFGNVVINLAPADSECQSYSFSLSQLANPLSPC